MDNKKTILYLITQSESGGAQRYIFDLSENLKNEFNIIVGFGKPEKNEWLKNKLTEINIGYAIIPHLKRAISPIYDLIALMEIIKLIKKIKPDIVHLNSSKISILGSIASKFASFAYNSHHSHYIIYTAHGWVFNEPMPRWKKLFYKYAEKMTAGAKDKIICVSEFDRQTAIKEKIAPEDKLCVVRNGLGAINFLSKPEAQEKINNKFSNRILIVSVGNLYETKGYEYLIQAVKLLVARYGLRIACAIIGEGGERKKLEKLIKKSDLENSVFLPGTLKNAAQVLNAFDIYACSSVKEGLSYSIIEAMQAGMPIVATKAGGNAELIDDQVSGILVPPRDPEKLAKAIFDLANDHALRENLGKSARQKALADFTLEAMVEKTKRLYLH